MVAVTVTVPAAVVLRILPPVIVAPVVPALLTLQVMFLFVAFAGFTVPASVSGVPDVAEDGTPVILVTGTSEGLGVGEGGGVIVTLPKPPPPPPQAIKSIKNIIAVINPVLLRCFMVSPFHQSYFYRWFTVCEPGSAGVPPAFLI